MQTFTGILAAGAGAALGYVVAFAAALAFMPMLGVSDFEGKRAMLAAFIFGPIGAVAGLIAGIMFARRLAAELPIAAPGAGWLQIVVVLVLLAAAAGAFYIYFVGDRPLGQNTAAPRLYFEMKIPAALSPPEKRRAIRINLDTDRNQMPADLSPERFTEADGVLTIPGSVELYYRTSERVLVLDLGTGTQIVFRPGIPASPDTSDWSEWKKADGIFTAPEQTVGAAPGPDDRYEARYRVEVYE